RSFDDVREIRLPERPVVELARRRRRQLLEIFCGEPRLEIAEQEIALGIEGPPAGTRTREFAREAIGRMLALQRVDQALEFRLRTLPTEALRDRLRLHPHLFQPLATENPNLPIEPVLKLSLGKRFRFVLSSRPRDLHVFQESARLAGREQLFVRSKARLDIV